MKSIKDIAGWLVKNNIAFNYENNYIDVRDGSFGLFQYASLHAVTKELILMDWKYQKVEIASIDFKKSLQLK